jgi:hypothetical protein
MVARVAIKERAQDAASHGVDDLVNSWERERIFWVVPVEIGIIHTHPPFIIILFQDKYRVSEPLWVIHFFNEASRE